MKLGAISSVLAIDLGTDHTRIYYRGNITDRPSVIAYNSIDGNVIALGSDAEKMIGRTPEAVTVIKPLSNGVITDFDIACQMIQGFINDVIGSMIRPKVLVCVPSSITDVERRAVCDAIRSADIRDVFVIRSPIAGAIGANCDVTLARGMMLVNIGGGLSEISVISLGQTVAGRSVKIGGNDFTSAIIDYVREKHNLLIGYHTAEYVKKEVGCVFQRDRDDAAEADGYNLKTRKPDKILIHSEETREAFSPLIQTITSEIKSVLDEMPTELLGDILEDGILLVGGGAQIYGLSKKLRTELGIKVFLAEDAQLSLIRGAASVADNLDNLPENTYVYTKG